MRIVQMATWSSLPFCVNVLSLSVCIKPYGLRQKRTTGSHRNLIFASFFAFTVYHFQFLLQSTLCVLAFRVSPRFKLQDGGASQGS